MAKKYDFSAFDDKEASKYDFSSFDEADQKDGSALEAFARSGAEAGTLGLSGEIGGGLKAGYDVATTDNTLSDFMDLYRKNRDELDASREQAAEASPIASVAGTVAGSLVPGMGIAKGLGAAATGVKGAMKAGALGGAALGFGTSKGDITKGEFGQVAKDVASEAALGAATGGILEKGIQVGKGALKGAKGLAKGLGEEVAQIPSVKIVGEAYKAGTKGINVNKLSELDSALESGIESAGKDVLKLGKDLSGQYTKFKEAIKAIETPVDATQVYTKYKNTLLELKSKYKDYPDLETDISRIDSFLKSFEDTQPIMGRQVIPEKVITVAAKPGNKESLLEEINRLELKSHKMGENAKYRLAEDTKEGTKYLSIEKIVDEPIGSAEELMNRITQGDMGSEGVKVKRSFENSSEGKKKAQTLFQNLKAKSVLEGKPVEYELVDDLDHGFYHVVEKKPPMVSVDETLGLESTGGGFKSDYSLPKMAQEILPTPEQRIVTQPASLGPEQQIGTLTMPDAEMPMSNLYDLSKRAGGEFSRFSPTNKLQTLEGRTAGANLDKELTDLVNDQAKTLSSGNMDIKDLNKKYSSFKNVVEKYFDVKPDPVTGEFELTPESFSKLLNKVRQSEAEIDPSTGANKYLEELYDGLEASGAKDLSESLKVKFGELSKNRATGKYLAAKSMIGPSDVLPVLNTRTAGRLANVVGRTKKSISDATPETMKNVIGSLALEGAKGAKLAGQLGKWLEKDAVGRNALIFSIMQNPEYREMIKPYFNSDEEK